jgi:peptidoglycan hydrolase-like protein with peptidoglycan-binding domain
MSTQTFENGKLKELVTNSQAFGKRQELSLHKKSNFGDPVLSNPKAGHHFSTIKIDGNFVKNNSCPHLKTPSYCPFGGACHKCPTVIQPSHTKNHISNSFNIQSRQAKYIKNNKDIPSQSSKVEINKDEKLFSVLFSGDEELKQVINRRKTLQSGNNGKAVQLIQKALIIEGYELSKFGADSKFGKETTKAVKQFQQRWRMSVDGIVGDKTLRLLDSHLTLKKILAIGEIIPIYGGLVKETAKAGLDYSEDVSARKGVNTCPASNKAKRLTVSVQPVVIANDDGTNPTSAPSLALSQNIWEKCCINLTVLSTKVIKKTAFRILDESPTDVPTVEESNLFKNAGGISGIQIFIPENFEQGGVIGKNISGGGGTYDSGKANPKIVVVEGVVPAVVAHEIGHALGYLAHDNANTVMKPTGAYNVANSSKVSGAVCSAARTGAVLKGGSGKENCCMFLK